MKPLWKEKSLGTVLQLEYGKSLDDRDRKPNGLYPVYGANGEKNRTDKFYHNKPTIIVGRKGSTGELTLTEPKFWPLDVTYFVTFDEQHYNLKFLYHLLTMLNLPRFAKGVKPGINRNEIYSQVIKTPPLPEQQRIVAILDEAFEGVAIAKANTEKNLQNAQAIFQSYLNAVFTQRGEGWIDRKLGDLSKINYGYTESACYKPIGPKFLRITDIQNNHVVWDTVPYCSIASSDVPKYQLAEGDIVFARTGATTGKSYLITKPPYAVFASYLIRVQLNTREILPSFLSLFFQTTSYWKHIKLGSSGSAQGGFNATKLGELMISYPKLEKEQWSIVEKLHELSTETRGLVTIYRQQFAALDALKKSLLTQAFTGNL